MLSKLVKRLATCKPSSETQGQSIGSGEKAGRKFSLRTKEPLGTDSHRTISKNSSGCRLLIKGPKNALYYCAQSGEHMSMSSFRVFVHDGYFLDHDLSSSGTKEMHAVRKLSVWYKILIWSNSLTCQMQENSSGTEFLPTICTFMKSMNFVIACLRPSQNVKLDIFTGSLSVGGKEMYKKAWCTCQVVVLPCQAITYLTFSSPPRLNCDPLKTEYSRGKFNCSCW